MLLDTVRLGCTPLAGVWLPVLQLRRAGGREVVPGVHCVRLHPRRLYGVNEPPIPGS